MRRPCARDQLLLVRNVTRSTFTMRSLVLAQRRCAIRFTPNIDKTKKNHIHKHTPFTIRSSTLTQKKKRTYKHLDLPFAMVRLFIPNHQIPNKYRAHSVINFLASKSYRRKHASHHLLTHAYCGFSQHKNILYARWGTKTHISKL